jgi:hypothetical protein
MFQGRAQQVRRQLQGNPDPQHTAGVPRERGHRAYRLLMPGEDRARLDQKHLAFLRGAHAGTAAYEEFQMELTLQRSDRL